MASMSYMNFALRRFISTTAQRFSAKPGADPSVHAAGVKFWRNMTLFVGFPCIALGMVNAYLYHVEHSKHPRPEFVPYEHLRIRNKPFPWGDGKRSLFHNPVKNALPDGYEVPDPNADNHH